MLGYKCQQTFCFQKSVDNAQQCFAYTPQENFPANNLNFHWRWRWWDQIQANFQNLFSFFFKWKSFSERLRWSSDWKLTFKGSIWWINKLTVWREKIAGRCQQTFENKKFADITLQCFALLPQVNFPTNNLNLHWRWWDWIQAIF